MVCFASVGRATALATVVLLVLAAFLPGVPAAWAADNGGLPDLPRETQILVDTPGTANSALAGVFNPAAWAMQHSWGAYLSWDDLAHSDRKAWAGAVSLRYLGFGWRQLRFPGPAGEIGGSSLDEYTLGLSAGRRTATIGMSYAWVPGGPLPGGAQRDGRLTAGVVGRWRVVSVGVASLWDLQRSSNEQQVDLGLRPLGPRLTLFGDAVCRKGDAFADIHTGYGVRAEITPKLTLAAKALSTGEVSLGVTLGLSPRDHVSWRPHLDNDGHRIASTWALEYGPPAARGARGLRPRGHRFPTLDLNGPMTYRRYRFFDRRRTLLSTLAAIERAAADPNVGGLVVNLSGMRVTPELQWELRAQLAGLRAAGKKVIVYLDRGGLFETMLASVADQIWMDPYGDLHLLGLATGRTYYKNAADKVGIGVDEWRFFKYKSAMESYSRTSMSPADREQRQALIDDMYETAVSALTAARAIPRERWEEILDRQGFLTAEDALAAGLVDSLGTWEQTVKAARTAGRRAGGDAFAAQLGRVLGDPVWGPLEWGEPARIAVLYAIGPCDMDTGIRARELAGVFRRAREDRGVKAVVLRVDSPGGDGMASDVVAREVAQTAKRKPVIVSQGQAAASGGYWISMPGDRIVSAPISITGSIGVIGGHAWNDSLGRKLGLTYDGVKRGPHADLYQGIMLPGIGQVLPERPLTPKERERAETLLRNEYHDFVVKVAAARKLPAAYVDSIGQGRVWSGTRAQGLKLVDDLGGLWDALRIAKERAGIPVARRVVLTEAPSIGMLNLEALRPKLFQLAVGDVRGAGDSPGAGFPGNLAGALSVEDAIAAEESCGIGPQAESIFWSHLLEARGRPLMMMEPLQIEDGADTR
jgi:protease-4